MDEEETKQKKDSRENLGCLYTIISFVLQFMVVLSPGGFDIGGAHQGESGLLINIFLYAFSFGFALSAYRLNRNSSITRTWFYLLLFMLLWWGGSILFFTFL